MPVTNPITKEEQAKLEAQALRHSYPVRILVGLDQFVNTLIGGSPDETISARSGRAAEAGKLWGIAMCKFLNLFQRNHGVQAQAGDLARAKQTLTIEKETLPVKDHD